MKYRTADKAPSDIFVNALVGFGTGAPDLTCGWCDRLHLCPDASYFHDEEDGSWKGYCQEEFAANPAGVVLHYDCDAVSAQEMNGVMFVLGCPCNGLARFEHFIWENRETIKNYLPLRQAQEDRWDEEELAIDILAGTS